MREFGTPNKVRDSYVSLLRKLEKNNFGQKSKLNQIYKTNKSLILDNIMNTIYSSIIGSHRYPHVMNGPEPSREWNPLSQRVVLNTPPQIPQSLSEQYYLMRETIQCIQMLSHEVMHVLLWEPLFSGKKTSLNEKTFIDYSLAFEGFCFFFVDFWMYPELNDAFPGGEPVLSRSSISQPLFSPRAAFKANHISRFDDVIKCYIDGFLGNKTKLDDKKFKRNSYANLMSDRMVGFYATGISPMRSLYSELTEMGIFTDFKKRFFDIEDLPSLLSKKSHDLFLKGDIHRYCLNIYKNDFNKILKLRTDGLKRIYFRRAIQTRAYYLHQVLFIVENQFYTGKITKKEILSITTSIKDSLDTLENLLNRFKKTPNSVLARQLSKVDELYETVHNTFKRRDAWVAVRSFILPTFPLKKIDLVNRTIDLDETQRFDFNDTIQFFTTLLNQKTIRSNINDLKTLFDSIEIQKNKFTKIRMDKNIHKILTKNEIIRNWSVPMCSIRPKKNLYRELFFLFE